MLENVEIPQPTQESFKVYKEQIKPTDKVLVVGPSMATHLDPSLFYISYLLGNKGSVLVADPMEDMSLISEFELSEKLGAHVTGVGGVKQYMKELDAFREKGIELARPEWLGSTSTAQHLRTPDGLPLLDNSLDIIVDHGTLVFIAGTTQKLLNFETGIYESKSIESRMESMREILQEYKRVLRPGGKILLQADSAGYELDIDGGLKFTDLLKSFGFSVQHQKVKDEFEIDMNKDVYEKWRNSIDSSDIPKEPDPEDYFGYNTVSNATFFHNFVKLKGSGYRIKLPVVEHESPDFYILTKP